MRTDMKKKQNEKIIEFRTPREAMEKLFPESKKIEIPPDPTEYGKRLADKLIETFKKELLKI